MEEKEKTSFCQGGFGGRENRKRVSVGNGKMDTVELKEKKKGGGG